MTDEELAADLAEGAGRLLLALRDAGGCEGRALGDAGDKAANDFLLAGLGQWRPDDPILSEESADAPERLSSRRVWIIDPLDGTREYCEGRDDWAVHVALAVGGRPALGAVAIPAQGRVYRTDRPSPPHIVAAPLGEFSGRAFTLLQSFDARGMSPTRAQFAVVLRNSAHAGGSPHCPPDGHVRPGKATNCVGHREADEHAQ